MSRQCQPGISPNELGPEDFTAEDTRVSNDPNDRVVIDADEASEEFREDEEQRFAETGEFESGDQ